MEVKKKGGKKKNGVIEQRAPAACKSSSSDIPANEDRVEVVSENASDDDQHVSPLLADDDTFANKAQIEIDDYFWSVSETKPRPDDDLQQSQHEPLSHGQLLPPDFSALDADEETALDIVPSAVKEKAAAFSEAADGGHKTCSLSKEPSPDGAMHCELRKKALPRQSYPYASDISIKRNGFYVLDSLESDSFDCDDCEVQERPYEASNLNLGKRNRQISTDSSSSLVLEVKNGKATKKPKKKERKKQAVDEEIDRIIAELNQSSKPVVLKENRNEKLQESASVIETINKPKKKSKRKTKSSASESQMVNDSSAEVILPAFGDGAAQTSAKSDEPFVELGSKSDNIVLETSCTISGLEDNANCFPGSANGAEAKKHRKRPRKTHLAAIRAALQKAKEREERIIQEEMAKQKRADELERQKLEKLRLEQERKERKKEKEKVRKERLKAEGKFLTKSQKLFRARVEVALSAWRAHGVEVPIASGKDDPEMRKTLPRKKSDPKMNSGEMLANDDAPTVRPPVSVNCGISPENCTIPDPALQFPPDATSRARTKSESDLPSNCTVTNRKVPSKGSKAQVCDASGDKNDESMFRSPVVCVLGHVDTGKTKILDKVRKTHVQDNEAGGITQQIGATMVPIDALKEKCSMAKGFFDFKLQLPGLLIIDTPGHESFRNLRSRGSSLCDIAVLVVDIMHGLEQQTLESIELLKQRKTPFVVALNKVDRLYGWRGDAAEDIAEVVRRQQTVTLMEFDKRCKQVIADFANQSLNAVLFYENKDPRSYVSLVPVSAVSGDGMGNLLAVVCQLCQKLLTKRLIFSEELEATVLEVKASAGLGTTIDVILVNGRLRETDTIVLAGHDGPIVTQIRSLLMPQPLRELRVKNPYQEFKMVKGAQGVKVTGKELDKAIAGLPLFVAKCQDDVSSLKDKVTRLFRNTINSIKLSERGVYVQASTLGSLEALLSFLKSSSIPYSGVKVGPVVKKDVIKASVMLEHDVQYAAILAFDVKVERDAHELADHLGIKIFQADIIYHLFDNFMLYKEELHNKKMTELKKLVVFPCKLSVLPQYVFSSRNPISIGVHVDAGVLKIGTPLCVPSKKFLDVGVVSAIECQHQQMDSAKEGDDVCITIEPLSEDAPKTYGKHFDHADLLVSKISRQTIDVCKEFYRDDLQKSDWHLMAELKKLFLIA